MLWFPVALAAPTASTVTQPGTIDADPVFDRDRPVLGDLDRELSASAEVVSGTREPRFGAAVALAFPGVGTFCSASMLTPRVALTAAHCVNEQGITPELVAQAGTVIWGSDASQPFQEARILAAYPHPAYGLSGQGIPENDVAVLEIEPVGHTETMWFNSEPIESEVGRRFTVVGYGINENGNNSSGRKRSAIVTFDEYFGDFIVSSATTNPQQANVCSGDSGGPMYGQTEDGRWLQYAVHSWSQPPVCRGLAGSTDTAAFTDFIENQIERVHGSDDMCENRGANDDAICDPECPDDVICAIQELGPAKGCQTSAAPVWLGALALFGVFARRR